MPLLGLPLITIGGVILCFIALVYCFPSEPSSDHLYRKAVYFGALPNAATKSVAHGVKFNGHPKIVHIYGVARDKEGGIFLPLPYSSLTLNQNVSLYATAFDVCIKTNEDYSEYTDTLVVIEYLES